MNPSSTDHSDSPSTMRFSCFSALFLGDLAEFLAQDARSGDVLGALLRIRGLDWAGRTPLGSALNMVWKLKIVKKNMVYDCLNMVKCGPYGCKMVNMVKYKNRKLRNCSNIGILMRNPWWIWWFTTVTCGMMGTTIVGATFSAYQWQLANHWDEQPGMTIVALYASEPGCHPNHWPPWGYCIHLPRFDSLVKVGVPLPFSSGTESLVDGYHGVMAEYG